jgi:hypothetical protein
MLPGAAPGERPTDGLAHWFGVQQAFAVVAAVAVDLERRIIVAVLGGAPKSAHLVCCSDGLCAC